MFSLQSFDIWSLPDSPRYASFIIYFPLVVKATVLFGGLLFPVIHAFLHVHPLCDLPVSLWSCWFLSFLSSWLPLPLPIPISFHYSHKEDIKLSEFIARLLEYLVEKKICSFKHIWWCSYKAKRIGRRFKRTIPMGNK